MSEYQDSGKTIEGAHVREAGRLQQGRERPAGWRHGRRAWVCKVDFQARPT